jgi:hypothetical protein
LFLERAKEYRAEFYQIFPKWRILYINNTAFIAEQALQQGQQSKIIDDSCGLQFPFV